MSQPELTPVEAGSESLSKVEFNSTQIDSAVKGQLSNPGDVQAAQSYFQPAGGAEAQTGLPDLSLDSGMPKDMSLDLGTNQTLYGGGAEFQGLNGHEFATANLGGGEQALLNGIGPSGFEGGLMPGLEQGVIAGMPPGTEPISPMIQMILKMPGLTGTVASFFEAIMSFLFPADGGIFNLLDPTMWAQTAQQAFGSIITAISNNIPMSVAFMQNTSPFFSSMMNNAFMHNGLFETLGKTATSINPPDLSFTGMEVPPVDANASNMFVNGQASATNPVFESASLNGGMGAGSVNVSGGTDLLAFDNGNSFGATVGGHSATTGVDPNSVTTSTATGNTSAAPDISQGQGTETMSTEASDAGLDSSAQSGDSSQGFNNEADAESFRPRGDLLNQSDTANGANLASSEIAQPQNYTVNQGDNLWNIARDHLGSGSRWTEIYNLNANIIGDNPNLIFPGSDLQLPGGAENIASAGHDYVVQSGDNLWNIARDHLGSGKEWPVLYQQNSGIIGSDPNLIHPGQHLAMSGNSGSVTLAHHQPQIHQPQIHQPQAHHQPAPSQTHHISQQPKPSASPTHAREAADPSTSEIAESPDNGNIENNVISDNNFVESNGETILKQAQKAAASARNEIEKTAHSPGGLRAVAKQLDI